MLHYWKVNKGCGVADGTEQSHCWGEGKDILDKEGEEEASSPSNTSDDDGHPSRLIHPHLYGDNVAAENKEFNDGAKSVGVIVVPYHEEHQKASTKIGENDGHHKVVVFYK
eukprot:CAMPEP_0173451300 /NCGR_PEP_ID=MMETSP1357-20121228/46523_1 /TAXON_ID=77926 /ORGANISM="Hemiselmis rufescens, Strain PCC563" /LENGTH=110 /DNA_ID=CAMNT_0014418051 /DNA_START=8 /DNA_END=340 /DNA_ORIENTATION=-